MQDKNLKQFIGSKINESIFKSGRVKLAYIFGSSIEPNRTPNDIDIAVLFQEKLGPVKYFELSTDLYLKLTPLFTQEIDVVILNEANSFFKYEVISRSILVYQDNETLDIEFKVQTLKEYFDARYKLKIYEQSLLNRIEKGVYQ